MRGFFAAMMLGAAAIAAAPLTPFGAPAFAQKQGATATSGALVAWREVRGWEIMVDPVDWYCLAQTTFDGGTLMRLGIPGGYAFVSLYNSDWRSVQVGRQYPVDVYFNNGGQGTSWNAQGARLGENSPGFYFTFTDESFVLGFMQRRSIAFYTQGQLIGHYSLDGSHAATMAMVECQREIAQHGRGSSGQGWGDGRGDGRGADPFQGRSSDPFQ